jgi:type VI protein secretion system component VasK
MDTNINLFLILILCFGLVIYFIPTIIASCNKCENFSAIFVLNLFLGWTFIGWTIALVWSFVNNEKKDQVIEAKQKKDQVIETKQKKDQVIEAKQNKVIIDSVQNNKLGTKIIKNFDI